MQELDLEHTRGVKILECASDRLVLQVARTRNGQSEWSGNIISTLQKIALYVMDHWSGWSEWSEWSGT